ncbi:hypothetical protein INT45_005376 [Circinella minor]|uniref:Uncharacterized protein n=1 Tax=Circinella minor TaxID=1195481 RepID=A0A8H7S111_9FUNG|nr:hypothetical protein INT45_005376 [Circinella minor]
MDIDDNRLPLLVYGSDAIMMFKDFEPGSPTDSHKLKLLMFLSKICSPDLYFDLGIKSYVVPNRGRKYRIDRTEFRFM